MGEDKLWLQVKGKPLLAWTLESVMQVGELDILVMVAPHVKWKAIEQLCSQFSSSTELRFTEGGERRQDSVWQGLQQCQDTDVVVVHDGARPLCPTTVWQKVMTAVRKYQAVTPALPVVDSLKKVEGSDSLVTATVDRAKLMKVQTPQAFTCDLLVQAHLHARQEGFEGDDDCALVEHLGHRVYVVLGDERNFKVTTKYDWEIFRHMVEKL